MDLFSIIIDRVGTTNVFNIVQGRLPSRDTHLQTIVDDDLIEEFLAEIERLSRISNSLGGRESDALPIDLALELRRIGETFFLQFFPEQIQERLRTSEQGFLFLHVDYRLRRIPWELLHDGRSFLAERLYLGKNVSGYWRDTVRPERERLRVLIVADPTEDLEWARREGEALFESLNAEQSADRLDVQFMAGRRITKLSLLNAMKDRDILHFSGHLHHAAQEPESGWLLSGAKVLRAREIEKAGLSPHLVFSNSCLSSPVAQGDTPGGSPLASMDEHQKGDLAGAFLRANIGNYIGTNWEISDSGHTADFALNFYRAIFEERSVGEALFEARRTARKVNPAHDLTWANYVLHGNPMTRIYRSAGRPTFDASRSQLNATRVIESYPSPIARSYRQFIETPEAPEDAERRMVLLVTSFERTLHTVGALIFGNYVQLQLKGDLPSPAQPTGPEAWLEAIFNCLRNFRYLKFETAMPGLLESLALHYDSLQKLLGWTGKVRRGEVEADSVEILLVTFQYLFDNLLSDLSALARGRILYILPNGEDAVLLHGQTHDSVLLGPDEDGDDSPMAALIASNHGHTCYYSRTQKVMFPLDDFLRYDPETRTVLFPAVRSLEVSGQA